MRWWCSPRAEVAWCRYQAAPEVVHPNAIDDHSCCQRVCRINDRFGQFQSATAFLKRLPFLSRKYRQKLSRYLAAESQWVPAFEYPRIPWNGQVLKCQGECLMLWRLDDPAVNLALKFP